MNLKILGNARLRHFKRGSFPSPSAMPLECGKCQNRTFEAYVEPREDEAKVVGLICQECRDVFRLDLAGFLDGTGKPRRVDLDEVKEVSNGGV